MAILVCGIDPSTSTGMVMLDMANPARHWAKNIEFKKARGFPRLKLIEQEVRATLTEWQPDVVYIEGYGFKNQYTLVCLVEIGSRIREALHDLDHHWVEVAPTQLKKWITGSGNADKKKMAVSVQERWQFNSKSDDVIDAFALAQFGRAHLAGELVLPPKLPKKRKHK
jgi:crossover junction endodeoxyribonuclease RuvC